MVDVTIRRGSRGFATGTSGSGKTTLCLALAEAMPSPLIVVDTKWDPGILAWAKRNRIRIWTKKDPPRWPNIKEDVVVRFRSEWLSHPEDIDWWLGQAFLCPFVPSIYIDEGYQVGATSSRIGAGVSGLWTRGRVFGMATLIATQRPVWINKFVITESDKIFSGRLKHIDDRKKMFAITGNQEVLKLLPKQQFFFIDQDEDEAVLLKPLDLGKTRVYSRQERLATRKKMVKIK